MHAELCGAVLLPKAIELWLEGNVALHMCRIQAIITARYPSLGAQTTHAPPND